MPPHNPRQITVGLLITQGHWGGAQRYVFDLATSLAHELRIIVGIGSPQRGKELQLRLAAWNATHPEAIVEVQELSHLVREISPWNDTRAIFEVKKFITRNQLDILHCNSAKASVIGTIASYGTAVRSVITSHGFTFTEPLSSWRKTLYRTLERTAARTADLLICPDTTSYTIARDLFHIPPTHLARIPHTIQELPFLSRDAARTALSRRTGFPITDRTHVIGSIANFYRVKNHALLLDSFAELARTDHHAICVLIGDGQERAALEVQRDRLACAARIFFVGAIEDAALLLRGFDVFAVTSDKEGYPYVLLEARAAGTPIVARAVGGCPELIAGARNAACVTDPTPATIATALATALDQPHTPSTVATQELMHVATRTQYLKLISN